MRTLFTTHGIPSNLRGMLPMAYAAQRAGHDVAIGTTADMKAEVEHHGFRHITAGHNWRPAMEAETQELGGELGRGLTADDVRYGLAARYFVGPTAYETASALMKAAETWSPELVIRSWTEFGGYLAAEALGVPHVSLGISGGPAAWLSPARLAPLLAEHRERLGLTADPSGETLYRYRHVALVPADYDPDVAALPNTVHLQHANLPGPADRLPAGLVDEDDDRPLVFVNFGTMAPVLQGLDQPRIRALMESVLSALKGLDCAAVIASNNPHHNGDTFGPLPENIRLVGGFPAPLLLEKKCDLFITHGGFNSVRESLSHGVPMVVIPLIAEQPHNAARCAALGVAEALPLSDASAENIGTACRRILTDGSYAARAAKLKDGITSLPSLDVLARSLDSEFRPARSRT